MGIYRKIKYQIRKINRIRRLEKSMVTPYQTEKKQIHHFDFPVFENPQVSIIIPFHNQLDYTLNCLKSIHDNLPQISFEIILMDDKSSEPISFEGIGNIRVIRNEENLGFLRSCNRGIQEAKGEFIYLLNNDTAVKKGFLDELFYVFGNFENVGVAGSMLLNADGTLQEAGSMLMVEGRIEQIASKKKMYYPDINYIYKVDYCSGCSMMFRKFSDDGKINLFDDAFAPAYFEDTDLCLSIKFNQGKDIYYTPFSQVYHFQGVSYNAKKNGKVSAKDKIYEKNKAYFQKKWKNQLAEIKATVVEERLLELNQNKNIFFYNNRVPEYDQNSGELRLTEIIKAYKKMGYNAVFVTRKNKIENPYNEYFQRLGVCVYYEHLALADLRIFYKRFKAREVIAWLYAANILKKYYHSVKKNFRKSFVVYDMVDIHHLRYQRALETAPDNKEYQKNYAAFIKMEKFASEKADIIIPISEEENQYMAHFAEGKKRIVISNIHYPKVNLDEIPTFEERKDLLFVGSTHHPNIDAVYFLVNEIMPIVWQKHPEIKLNVVGGVNESIHDIKNEKVIFHGFQPDINPFFLNNRIMVAPLRFGAGVKGKIGQAFEFFLPVVASGVGAEGMLNEKKDNILLAETAEEFAEKIIEIYTDKNLWIEIQNRSLDTLDLFSRETLYQKINQINPFA